MTLFVPAPAKKFIMAAPANFMGLYEIPSGGLVTGNTGAGAQYANKIACFILNTKTATDVEATTTIKIGTSSSARFIVQTCTSDLSVGYHQSSMFFVLLDASGEFSFQYTDEIMDTVTAELVGYYG